MGLAGYYRHFVLNISSIASLLSNLTKKSQPDQVQCTSMPEQTFQQLKEALTSVPVNLTSASPSWSTWMLQTHNFALFFLQNFEGEEHSVLYISRNLSPTKKLYDAMEREALTLLRGLLTG